VRRGVICELLCTISLALSFYALSKKEVTVKVEEIKLKKERTKERRRYILVQVISEDPHKVNDKCLDETIKSAIKEMYGLIGLALAKPKLVYLDVASKMAIVRTTLEGVKLVASSMLKVENGCNVRIRLVPLRAFGTLASARERIPEFHKSLKHP